MISHCWIWSQNTEKGYKRNFKYLKELRRINKNWIAFIARIIKNLMRITHNVSLIII
jgi:hypothetical protein